MIINWHVARTKPIGPLIVDLIMLAVALLNLLYFSFDLTYFSVRDYYLAYTPNIAALYDPVKGIHRQRFTENYIARAEGVFRRYANFAEAERRQRLDEMTRLSIQMIDEDPFQRANKSGDLEVIKERFRQVTGTADSSRRAVTRFWQLTPDNVAERALFFRTRIKPIMATNFSRYLNRAGRTVDYFFRIDGIFVAIFLLEFAIMWGRAIHHHGPDQRVLYPMARWYDLLGCVPIQSLRVMRLFRVLEIYRRLVAYDLLVIGDGPFTRLVQRYRTIVSEELTDLVSRRILQDIQEKVRIGGGRTIIEQTLRPHKPEIQKAALKALRHLEAKLIRERRAEWVRHLTDVAEFTIQQSPEYAKALRTPLIGTQIERMFSRTSLESLVGGALDRFADAVSNTLHTDDGVAFVQSLVNDVLEEVITLSRDELVQSLITSINDKLLDELMEDSRTVKRWRSVGTTTLKPPS